MNRKNLVHLFVILAMFAALIGLASPVAAAGAATVYAGDPSASPAYTVVKSAATTSFAFPIYIQTSQQTRSYSFDLAFDHTKLQIDTTKPNVTTPDAFWNGKGVLDAGWLMTIGGAAEDVNGHNPVIDNTLGTLTKTARSVANVTGVGATAPTNTLIATVYFTVIGSWTGLTDITLTNVVVGDNALVSAPETVTLANGGVGHYQRGGPDLAITGLGTTPNGSDPTQFQVNFTVINNGDGDAAADTVTVSVDNGATGGPLTQTLNALAAGAHQDFVFNTAAFPFALGAGKASTTVTAKVNTANKTATAPYSLANGTGNTEIDAQSSGFSLTVTAPAACNFATVLPVSGTVTKACALNVISNAGFKVDLYDANAETQGHMAEWYTGNYITPGGKKLTDAFKASPDGTPLSFFDLPYQQSAAHNLYSGLNTPDAGTNYTITYSQTTHTSDAPLFGGHTYHIQVTYYAYISF